MTYLEYLEAIRLAKTHTVLISISRQAVIDNNITLYQYKSITNRISARLQQTIKTLIPVL